MKSRPIPALSLVVLSAAAVVVSGACSIRDIAMRKSLEDLAVTHLWQDTKMVLQGSAANVGYGNSVGMSANYAIIGAPGVDSFQGAAILLARSGSSWTALPPLYSSTRVNNDLFGYTVAISDQLAAAASNGTKDVEIFQNSAGIWSWAMGDTGTTAGFGSLDVWNDYVIAGDSTDGIARIYHKSGVWVSAPLAGSAADKFGCSVSISESWAVVGADEHDGTLINSGIVYVYQRSGTNSWTLTQSITPPTEALNSYFGQSVCVRGTQMIIGERGASKVHFYEMSGSQWAYQGFCFVKGTVATDEFGTAVVIASGVAATGAFGKDSKAGIVYPFEYSSGAWRNSIQTPLSYAGRAANDNFGQSVSMNDDFMLIGAPWIDGDNGVDSGAAFLYEKVDKIGK